MAGMTHDFLTIMLAQGGPPPPTDAEVAAAMASMFFTCGIAVVFILGVTLAIGALIGWLIKNAMQALPPEFRRYSPNKGFLVMIPFFNLYWNFVAFPELSDSYAAYFHSIGRTDVGDAGRQVGWWYALCSVLGLVPCVGSLAGPASLVLLIIHLVKIYDLKKQIAPSAATQP